MPGFGGGGGGNGDEDDRDVPGGPDTDDELLRPLNTRDAPQEPQGTPRPMTVDSMPKYITSRNVDPNIRVSHIYIDDVIFRMSDQRPPTKQPIWLPPPPKVHPYKTDRARADNSQTSLAKGRRENHHT